MRKGVLSENGQMRMSHILKISATLTYKCVSPRTSLFSLTFSFAEGGIGRYINHGTQLCQITEGIQRPSWRLRTSTTTSGGGNQVSPGANQSECSSNDWYAGHYNTAEKSTGWAQKYTLRFIWGTFDWNLSNYTAFIVSSFYFYPFPTIQNIKVGFLTNLVPSVSHSCWVVFRFCYFLCSPIVRRCPVPLTCFPAFFISYMFYLALYL